MFDYLKDRTFLEKIDKMKIRTQYAKIILLDFAEKPIKEIQGIITAGSLSVNGSAAIRRTINLTMNAAPTYANLENLDNEISLNKKVKVQVGFKNPFKEYKYYGDIIWFPCGLFVTSSASQSRGTSGWTINYSGKDKMVLLDGSVGGIIPYPIEFHQKEIGVDETGKPIFEQTLLIQMIREAVSQFGGEDLSNIFIYDLEETAKVLVKYIGDQTIYLAEDGSHFLYTKPSGNDASNYTEYNTGDDIGYRLTDFTYAGELVLKGGDSVVTLLTKIKDFLGNFEFFYDLDGKFIFQEKKNYLNQTSVDLKNLGIEDYIQDYTSNDYEYSLVGLETETTITHNPKYDNIKNDFIVVATKDKIQRIYHCAIDKRPAPNLVNKYIYYIEENGKKIWQISDEKLAQLNSYMKPAAAGGYREEMYREAFLRDVNGEPKKYYDIELLAFWRDVFNPDKTEWPGGWNPAIDSDPSQLKYWFDVIDEDLSAAGKYSINKIGRRSKVVNSTDISTLFIKEIPDIMFLTTEEWANRDTTSGQQYFHINEATESLFAFSSSQASAFDKIRELMYQHLSYNTQLTVQTFPKYYFEPNNIIYIEDKDSGIRGNYSVSQFTLPLTYNGMMSITATELLTRV